MPYQKPLNICPVCKKKADFKFIQDYKNKWGNWSLYECSECRVQFWMPFKNPGAEYYKRNYIVENVILYGYHKHFLKTHKSFSKGTRVLDLGCGTGGFIAELQKKGCEVWGIDIDKNAIDFIKKYFKLENVFAMSFDEFFKFPNLPKFDVITFFEVIEHLDNPLEFIQNASKLLKEDGIIVLSTPSRERTLVNQLESDFPPAHLTRWNKEAIFNLFGRFNFNIIRISYINKFKIIFNTMSEKFNFGLVMKTMKTSKNKEIGDKESIVIKGTPLTKIVHLGAYFKDYLLWGIPAIVLFLIGRITGRKNGDMLIWLKKT